MDDFFTQIQAASDANLYFVALMGALVIPDIGGAMDSRDGKSSGGKYRVWFNAYAAPKFAGSLVSLTSDDCYRYRCAMVHQGRLDPKNRSRLLFIEPIAASRGIHMNELDGALQVDVRVFVEEMVPSAGEWLAMVRGTEPFETNLASSMRRHPHGLPPYIGGVPVIA